MGEWSSYRLDDFLMYSPRVWYRMLELHHRAWWPVQVVAATLGAGLLWAIHRRHAAALRLALVLVGASLLFVAWAFHGGPHASINLAAPYYAVAFGIEGLLLLGLALLRRDLVLAHSDGPTGLAVALLALALLLYPALALLWARPLAQAEWFALAPDPTMLAALALLLLVARDGHGLRHPRRTGAGLSILPLSWCVVTGTTSWVLGAPDWWLMPSAALLVCLVALWRQVRPPPRAAGRWVDR
ncbi:DUF6064 family protein [Comamonadaceae bacterium G21597-S1]|nr:DUF6064 family protein [Comamonadaceae bacterium G21597-S1]